jgi:hypothetical protein
VNGSDVRLAIDRCTTDHNELVIRGFMRVRGEIPLLRVVKVLDEDGEPQGFQERTGVELLRNADQHATFEALPASFAFSEAKKVYGRADQATADFLNKCVSAGVVRKRGRVYEKLTSVPAIKTLAA